MRKREQFAMSSVQRGISDTLVAQTLYVVDPLVSLMYAPAAIPQANDPTLESSSAADMVGPVYSMVYEVPW